MNRNHPYSPIVLRSPDRKKQDMPKISEFLHEPLLLPKEQDDKDVLRSKKVLDNSNIDIDEELKSRITIDDGRKYANNAPKIFLETITASTALIVIALTYIFFIVGFAIDFYTTYNSFNRENIEINTFNCGSINVTRNLIGCSASSHSNNYEWNSTVTKRSNVLSFNLHVQQTNITHLFTNRSLSFSVEYNLNVWACYQSNGCDSKLFIPANSFNNDGHQWQQVLSMVGRSLQIDLVSDLSQYDYLPIEATLAGNTFQNQESIPSNGLVKSYFLSVEYTNNPPLFAGNSPYIFYNFNVVSRPSQLIAQGVTVSNSFLLINRSTTLI